ncbi:AraC family transcriptional regulator [Mangrovicoccus algicola]|uniref:AraC family transcriptional regulator n=1 Tax=Mangrovicoccus algicola TaxID=2771008 RepID=A0A8J7CWT7_9RHOB|nr:AraC family transcriptional regulator [Mangrovicoccus algicola]MBE3638157.1 AraC family transcriptional regulator [Mangrovicoccus algicola]
MDPLSQVISHLRPHDCVAAGLDAGGAWSIRFERHAGLKCNAILKGRCWLAMEGRDPISLEEGDCVILPHGRSFVMSAKRPRDGRDAETVYAPVSHGGTAMLGGGGDFFMMGSRFLVSGLPADRLLRTLPSVMHIRAGAEQASLKWVLNGIASELRNARIGGAVSIAHLSHLVLVQALRHHLAGPAVPGTGWLAALADGQLCIAIGALHDDPARDWSVAELGTRAGLSRTAFATRFAQTVGVTPMAYLTEWRMCLAAEQLARGSQPVARIGREVGYASESAFAAAFKRVAGQTPRQYRRASKARPV